MKIGTMKNLPKVDKKDWKYMTANADPTFSPERNKRIIDKTIKNYEAMLLKKERMFTEGLAERTDAAAYYVKHLQKGKSTPAEKYFGRRTLAYLRGKFLLDRLKDQLTVIKGNKVLRTSGNPVIE